MRIYMLLAILTGLILIEGVAVQLFAIINKQASNPLLSQVTDLGRYLNRWVLPMLGFAVAGATLLKLGEIYPLGGLLAVSGSLVYSLFLVMFLIYMTSEPQAEDLI
ncbi:MAG: hypothetical protein HY896_11370 [Deltaproteobacteria bacterium]|nr:hypothetical protein [Deltaproteobacteria bacterium]